MLLCAIHTFCLLQTLGTVSCWRLSIQCTCVFSSLQCMMSDKSRPAIVSRDWTLPLAFFTDGIIVFFVIGPCVVAAWRGTWQLMDIYLLPESRTQSAWSSFIGGLGVIFILNFLQHPLLALTEVQLRIPINDYRVISRVHSFILGLAVINMWRGFWTIQDIYLTKDLNNVFHCGLIGLTLLWSCRAIKNASFPPLGVARDSKEGLFKFVTRLRTDNNMLTCSWSEMSYYLIDVFLTYAIIHSLVVLFWRSVWLLTDAMLFPNDTKFSAIASVIIGYSIYLIYIPLQFPAALVAKSITSFSVRIAFEDFYHFVLHMGLVNAWRGTWMLYDLLVFPDNQLLSASVTCGAGVLVLYLIDTARSIGCVGCAIDAGEEDGASVYLEHYLHIVVSIPSNLRDMAGKANELYSRGQHHILIH